MPTFMFSEGVAVVPAVTLPGVVIGVDIGTTSTKAVAYDTDGRQLGSHLVGYPLNNPQPGYAEQDPQLILEAVLKSISIVVAELVQPVAGLSFSSAMHSLIGLDPDGNPLTPSVTWADSRSTRQAERLRAVPSGLALHRRTGTPMHPMSPLPKLLWFAEQEPKLFERVAHWVGIKDWVLLRLCGALVTDHSIASATGLLDIHKLEWDPEALTIAGITPEQLPQLVATTAVLPNLTPQAAAQTGLPERTPVVVGAGDGPLANLGLGAVHPGMVACSIGTSGAMRVMVERPAVDPLGGVFCYALTEHRWAVGGAINNGGIVLKWAGAALAPDLGEHSEEDLVALAARAPVGSGGLIMLPYLHSERAPHWSALPRGAYVGLTHAHRREHLVRAALEGVCQQLALVLSSVRAAGNEVREVRAGGGFARSGLWRQMLADALGLPVSFPAAHEGSSFGAALLGMEALGLIPSIDVAADLVRIEETVRPDPAAAATYAALLPLFAELYEALTPAFASIRRMAPGLPTGPEPQA
ncbi:gluconokinase [Micromonospora saelicesensis]|uniref:Gluconokinase n=1 Tax=Micromonospora saelicesensis TaxID=285676 RepID=A0ABX9CJH7_9ACTN|nr:gluconokinase [Micromonospora saelicesensis]RAN99762.1 Gluconokinase [Micromonospora saelicesensis]RAO52749.1 Gluconokinase [Micromonospora saelicesensis]RAO57252.1 Gluconokinase [Micromonospora saelicesensis]